MVGRQAVPFEMVPFQGWDMLHLGGSRDFIGFLTIEMLSEAVVAYFRAWDVPKLRQKQDEKDANTGSGHSAE